MIMDTNLDEFIKNLLEFRKKLHKFIDYAGPNHAKSTENNPPAAAPKPSVKTRNNRKNKYGKINAELESYNQLIKVDFLNLINSIQIGKNLLIENVLKFIGRIIKPKGEMLRQYKTELFIYIEENLDIGAQVNKFFIRGADQAIKN